MADREILREFLVSLGFQIDKAGAKKFVQTLGVTNKVALGTTGAIVGVAIAAEEMVRRFASSMSKLYYVSQRTRTPVAQLQSFRYAAEQIGISAEDAVASVESLSAALRTNPGKLPLLQALGVSTGGKNNLQMLKELVDSLNKKFPYWLAQQFAAENFGIPEHVFFQLTNNFDELIKKEKQHQDLLRSMGVDSEAAAKAARDYDNQMKELGMRFDLVTQKIGILLLPKFRELIGAVNLAVDDIQTLGGLDVDFSGLHPALKWLLDDMIELKNAARDAASFTDFLFAIVGIKRAKPPPKYQEGEKVGGTRAVGGAGDDRVAALQRQIDAAKGGAVAGGATGLRAAAEQAAKDFGIPPALFAALVKKESNWNPRALSPKGAMGLSQLMPGTAKDEGVDDPWDPVKNLRGGASYLAKQFQRFGNWRDALAAYNIGPNAPSFKPSYGYADSILGSAAAAGKGGDIILHQETKIEVHGSDAPSTARAVANEQRSVNADLTRVFATVPR